jgi:hypothetical protein
MHSEASGTILAGGIALVGGALAFLGVFSYLAARFQYPEVLDGSAPEVLPALLATGATGRAVWALFGLSRHQRALRWLSWWSIATGVLGLIGMWRNVTPAVDVVAAAYNYLLPAWMIGFGVWLVIMSRTPADV